LKSLNLFIASLVFAIFLAGSVYADTTYVIKKGDNLYNLAKRYKVRTQEIARINGLGDYNIKLGSKIIIPSNRKETHSKSKITRVKDGRSKKAEEIENIHDDTAAANRQEYPLCHTAKKGDTLLSISKKYSVSTNELREINNLRTKRLKRGQRLIVKETIPTNCIVNTNYTVKRGDTVWNISKRFNLDPDELMDINGFETDSLKPGQKILLTAESEIKEQKTYDAILSQAHMEKEIEKISGSKEIGELGLQDRVTLFAKKLLNIPYRFGGNSIFGIDCSAYVKRVYSLIGIALPRSAREQFQEGRPVDGEELSIGDLVFFRTYASFPSHVGIYLGNNLFIHASSRSKKVTIDSLDTPYYLKRFIGAKRLLDVKDVKEDMEKEG